MSDDTCICPASRGLSDPHLVGCPLSDGKVLIFRNPETSRPVAVPSEIVEEHERSYKAWVEHTEGKSWDLIAAEGGWPSAKACQAEVKRYLEEGKSLVGDWKRAELKQMAWDRYERLFSLFMTEALKGKVQPGLAAMAAVDRMVKLANLDIPDADDATDKVPTVVVPSEEYIASLQRAAGES